MTGTLGRPTFAGQFDQRDWYYVSRDTSQLAFSMPRPTEQTVLHVRFDAAGNVESVNRTGLELVANIQPSSDKTPTLGSDRSLLEELFGNIGAVGQRGQSAPTADNPRLIPAASADDPPRREHRQGHQVRGGRAHRRDLHRLLHADQHRPDHRVAAQLAQQLGRDVGGLQAGHDQHVGRPGQAA